MNRTLTRLGMAFSLLFFICLTSAAWGAPFIPLQWQGRVKAGPLEGQRKHIQWVRDLNGDYLDDAFEALKPGEKTSVIVQLNDCNSPEELKSHFSSYGTVAYTGVIVAFVVIHDVPQERLADLAKDSLVAAVEMPRKIETTNDTSTRGIRQRASSTYSPNTFADAFPGVDGSGVNIAIVDSGVDDAVHAGFAGKFVSGYNALTSTAGNPDDDSEMPVIVTGADGICNSTAAGDDVQEVPNGQTPIDMPCVGPGINGVIDSAPTGDDFTGTFAWPGGCSSAPIVATGANAICNTAALGDDYQLVPVGNRPTDLTCISPGPNGVINTVPGGDDGQEVVFHGTHVAGIALGLGIGPGCRPADDGSIPNNCAGVAPGAGLVDVKVLNSQGSGWDFQIMQALDWLWQDGNADVVNMSVGSNIQAPGTDAISGIINALVANDIPVVVTSGNSWGNCIGSIGASSLAITVAGNNDLGTVNRADDIFSKFSTFGPRMDINLADPTVGMLKPDITAPGSNIVSVLGETGNTADGYHDMGGTSMSAPHVAGAAALLKDLSPNVPAGAIKELLKRTAFETPQHTAAGATFPAVDPVWNDHWGYGLLDLYAAADQLTSGITDMSFTDCIGPNPSYPGARRCLLSGGKASYDNNVDIQLAVDPPIQGQPNTITITVENRGPLAAQNVVVCTGVKELGGGLNEFYAVGCKTIANIAALASGSVNIPWTPTANNHQCIQSEINYPFDTDFTNNQTQLNTNPVLGSSVATANFRIENPLHEKGDILLELILDEAARKNLESVEVEGVPIKQMFTMGPEDCPLIGEIIIVPNTGLRVGSKAKITVAGKVYSETYPQGMELSGVVFNYEKVHPGLQRAYTCARHRDEGLLMIPVQLDEERPPSSDPRRYVQMVKAIFNVPVQAKDSIHDAIRIEAWGGSQIPEYDAWFEDGTTVGKELTIEFKEPLPNKERYRFDLEGFADQDGDALTGDSDFELRVIQGDANGNGAVTATDVSFVRGRINREVKFGSSSRADGNQTGTVTATDISYVRGRIGSYAP